MNDYDKQAKEWLELTNTSIKKGLLGASRDYFNLNDPLRYVFSVTLTRGASHLKFKFATSIRDYQDGRKLLRNYDILAYMDIDYSEDVWEFAENYGYVLNSKKEFVRVSKIFEEVKRCSDWLLANYSESELKLLGEIS